jgi:hypothetical protein
VLTCEVLACEVLACRGVRIDASLPAGGANHRADAVNEALNFAPPCAWPATGAAGDALAKGWCFFRPIFFEGR